MSVPAPTAPLRAAPAHTSRRRRRLATAILAGTACFTALSALDAAPVAAVDNSIVSATPAPNTTVDVSPVALSLVFANPLGPTNSVTLTCGAEGQPAAVVGTPKPLVLADQVTLSVTLASPIPKGVCNVVWRVTDLNLQPAGSGSYTFVIANDTVATTPSTTTTVAGQTGDTTATTTTTIAGQTPAEGEVAVGAPSRGPLSLFRFFSNMFVAVLFGSIIALATCWPTGVEFSETQNFLRIVYGGAVVSTLLFVGALAADLGPAPLGSSLSPTGWGPLLDVGSGTAALLRLAFTVASGYAVFRPERIVDPAVRLQALGLPALAVVTMGFARPEFGLIEWFAGVTHALSMSAWFGGLALMARVVLAGRGTEETTAAVLQYSRWSTPVLWATILSGLLLFVRLDSGNFTTSHGLVILAKTVTVSLMVFVALVARQYVRQHLAEQRRVKRATIYGLRRSFSIEAGIGLAVLGLTSWLLTFTPPGLVRSEGPPLTLGAVHRFQNPVVNADIVVQFSETVGANDVRIEVVQPATDLTGLEIDFVPPVGSTVSGTRVVPSPLTGAGVAVLEKTDGLSLGSSGNWTVVVRVNAVEVGRIGVFVGSELALPTTTTIP